MQLQADKAALEAQMLDLQQNASKGETELKAEKAALAAQVQQLQDTLSLKDIDITGLKTALEAKNADSQTLQEAVEKKEGENQELKSALEGRDGEVLKLQSELDSLKSQLAAMEIDSAAKLKQSADDLAKATTTAAAAQKVNVSEPFFDLLLYVLLMDQLVFAQITRVFSARRHAVGLLTLTEWSSFTATSRTVLLTLGL